MHTRSKCAVGMVGLLVLTIMVLPEATIAQASTEYVPGHMYVIRISDTTSSRDSLEQRFPTVVAAFNEGHGLMTRFKEHLVIVRSMEDKQWFVAYFDADRQGRDDLRADMELLTWYFHGHQGLIYPLEALESPWNGRQVLANGRR